MIRGATFGSLAALVASLIVLGASGCDREPTGAERSNRTAGAEHHYSSFGVRLPKGRAFDLISFKDVGLGRERPTPTDPILETIAQSLAYELQLEQDLELGAHVVHDRSLADPGEHTYCEGERIYVDIWRTKRPDRWGYSLWSGCSRAHKFAGNEVPIGGERSSSELEEMVRPLTRDIADSIAAASEEGCYRRTC